MSKNARTLSQQLDSEATLFEKIQSAIDLDNKTTNSTLAEIAEEIKLSDSFVKGSSSFYDFLNAEEKAHDTLVCQGTACMVNGSSSEVLKQYKKCGKAMCVGHCYQGGALLKRDSDGRLSSFCHTQQGLEQKDIPVYGLAESNILTSKPASIEALYQTALENQNIPLELEHSKLRGRGGGGFLFAFKCEQMAKTTSKDKYIVCNADEGDPGAFSDRYLLEEQPHKVMAGMYAAGIAAGANTGYLYIRYEYPEAITAVEHAIKAFNALDDSISKHFSFRIVPGAGSYVCGEETALLNSIEGLRPEVRTRPPYPATYGLWGRPTIVSNVETFANIPWILQNGGDAFAAIGTQESKGTKLISLDSQFNKPGLYEVDFGYAFEQLIYTDAGGFNVDVKALQVGGPLGSIVATESIDKFTLDFESFQTQGFALGHAGIIAIPSTFPMLKFMHHIFAYMADESCGKCTPCRLGTAKAEILINDAITKKSLMDGVFLEELLSLLETTSLCALGGGIPLPIRNIINQFEEELTPYFI